jgi:hypothetical protein
VLAHHLQIPSRLYDLVGGMKLAEAQQPIREALQRLADSPREHRCYVIVQASATSSSVLPSRSKRLRRISLEEAELIIVEESAQKERPS